MSRVCVLAGDEIERREVSSPPSDVIADKKSGGRSMRDALLLRGARDIEILGMMRLRNSILDVLLGIPCRT